MVFLLSFVSGVGALLISTPVYVFLSLSIDQKDIAGYLALVSAVVWIVVVQVWGGFKLARQHQRLNGS